MLSAKKKSVRIHLSFCVLYIGIKEVFSKTRCYSFFGKKGGKKKQRKEKICIRADILQSKQPRKKKKRIKEKANESNVDSYRVYFIPPIELLLTIFRGFERTTAQENRF